MKLRMPNSTSGNLNNFHNMILLSLVVHFVVITLVLITVPSSPRHITFGPIYSVQLVGSDVALTKDAPVLSDYINNRESSFPSIIKREIAQADSIIAKKEETNKVNVEKAIDSIKQKEAAHPETGLTSKKANSATVTGYVGRGTPSDQAAAQRNEYLSLIWARVKGNWTLPPALMPKENVETIIAVRISRSGALEHIEFEKSSGNRYFDDSALNAVKKSTPFPPLPSYIFGKQMEIGIRFHSSELH